MPVFLMTRRTLFLVTNSRPARTSAGPVTLMEYTARLPRSQGACGGVNGEQLSFCQ